VRPHFRSRLFADDLAGVRCALEIGLYFVLCEGLVRRLVPPEIGTIMLAFKFVYFPLVYIFFMLRRRVPNTPRVPIGIVLFLCWGVLISFFRAQDHPFTTAFGIAVNLTFVPIAMLAGGVYRTRQDVARALLRLAVFGALVGVLAMYEIILPVNHWLNRSMNLSTGLDERVSGTFQYPTVFGNFLMGGTVAGLAAISLVTKKSTKLLLVLGWLAFEIGGFLSGSRIGSLGSAVILVLAAILSTKWVKHTALIASTILVILLAVAAGARGVYRTELAGLNLRATETMDLGTRIQQFYFGDRLRDALEVSHGVGTGWGPFTMGIDIYPKRLGFDENLPPNYQDRGGYSFLEGGYSYILAETGIVGFILFGCMHFSFAAWPQRQATLRWLGPAIGVWSLLGNIPLGLQEIPVLAVPWWFLTGLYWSTFHQSCLNSRTQTIASKFYYSPRQVSDQQDSAAGLSAK
jgi:hypothetical protein